MEEVEGSLCEWGWTIGCPGSLKPTVEVPDFDDFGSLANADWVKIAISQCITVHSKDKLTLNWDSNLFPSTFVVCCCIPLDLYWNWKDLWLSRMPNGSGLRWLRNRGGHPAKSPVLARERVQSNRGGHQEAKSGEGPGVDVAMFEWWMDLGRSWRFLPVPAQPWPCSTRSSFLISSSTLRSRLSFRLSHQ